MNTMNRPNNAPPTLVRLIAIVMLALLTQLTAPNSATAQVRPGDVITDRNADKARELVSPGVYLRITRGMSMQIVPTERIEWPPPYRDATEKYSSQVRLSNDPRSLVGYVAGLPFPFIDPNDPGAGIVRIDEGEGQARHVSHQAPT